MNARLTLSGLLAAGLLLGGAGGGEEVRRLSGATDILSVRIPLLAHGQNARATTGPADRIVELAICLDTSGSMDGLINAARQKLWSIVNDLALAEPTPKLRVALLTYGNDGHAPENGWVQVNIPFTEDLDKVSEMLFALTTNGGTELVARVVQTATQELEWNNSTDALKIIVVAGNESADQDQEYSFRDICKAAISTGVMVNSIYCRYHGDGAEIEEGWREVARLADGQYASIDQNNTVPVIATPHDDALIELSSRLNETYIPFGAEGAAGAENQWAQDRNAMVMNKMAAASRAQTKGGALYSCSWDLCDATRLEQVKIEEIKEEDLPDYMRAMTMDERKLHVEEMRAKRADIQKDIEAVTAEREKFIVAEQKRQATNGIDQFDLVILGAIRDQARAKGFEMPEAGVEVAAAAGELPYFVQIGTTWVASDIAGEFERAFAQGQPFAVTREIEEDADGYAALLAALPEDLRKSLISIEQGRAIVRHDGAIYAVTMKAEPIEGDAAAGLTNQQTFQLVDQQLATMNRANQAGQVRGQQSAQGVQTVQVVQLPAPSTPPQRGQRQQQQQEEVRVEPAPKPFVQRELYWIDRAFVEEYDALIAKKEQPKYDETVPNTPEGRESLLARLPEAQRKQAETIFADQLKYFNGGLIVRIDGKLVLLQFGC